MNNVHEFEIIEEDKNNDDDIIKFRLKKGKHLFFGDAYSDKKEHIEKIVFTMFLSLTDKVQFDEEIYIINDLNIKNNDGCSFSIVNIGGDDEVILIKTSANILRDNSYSKEKFKGEGIIKLSWKIILLESILSLMKAASDYVSSIKEIKNKSLANDTDTDI